MYVTVYAFVRLPHYPRSWQFPVLKMVSHPVIVTHNLGDNHHCYRIANQFHLKKKKKSLSAPLPLRMRLAHEQDL